MVQWLACWSGNPIITGSNLHDSEGRGVRFICVRIVRDVCTYVEVVVVVVVVVVVHNTVSLIHLMQDI